MPSLLELQRSFSAAIFGAELPPLLAQQSAGLRVHRANVLANLEEALAAVYPVTRRVVGDVFFGAAARCYVHETPSTSADIHQYGARFANLLQKLPGAAALTYLPPLARLEWAAHEVFHAADHPAIDLERVRAALQDGEIELEIALHPACRLQRACFAVQRIWHAHQGPEDPPPLTVDDEETRLLIIRRGETISIEPLPEFEYALLCALEHREPIECALARASCLTDPDALQHLLMRRLLDGTLVERLHPEAKAVPEGCSREAAPAPFIRITDPTRRR
jgi:hypothetical protein